MDSPLRIHRSLFFTSLKPSFAAPQEELTRFQVCIYSLFFLYYSNFFYLYSRLIHYSFPLLSHTQNSPFRHSWSRRPMNSLLTLSHLYTLSSTDAIYIAEGIILRVLQSKRAGLFLVFSKLQLVREMLVSLFSLF